MLINRRPTFALGLPAPPVMERQVSRAPPPLPPLPDDIMIAVFDVITSVYGRPGQRQMMCRDAHVTSRTGQHWMNRTHAPRISQLFRMMEARPEFKKAIQALINRL